MTHETFVRSHYPIEGITVHPILQKASEVYASLLWSVAERINVSVEIPEKTEKQIRDHLYTGGSVLLLSNHESHVDNAVIYSRFVAPLQQNDPNISVLFVAGNKLFPDYFPRTLTPEQLQENSSGLKKGLSKRLQYWFEGTTMRIMARHKSIQLLPIIQGDQRINQRIVAELAVTSLNTLNKELQKPKTIAYFSLEGGRSESGELQQAKTGLNRLLKSTNTVKLLFVPLGLIGTRDVLSKDMHLNLHSPVQLRVGLPFFADEIRNDVQTYGLQKQDLMMLRVVELLPEEKWGYYRDPQFNSYLVARMHLLNTKK